jgi:hypothetical protein
MVRSYRIFITGSAFIRKLIPVVLVCILYLPGNVPAETGQNQLDFANGLFNRDSMKKP